MSGVSAVALPADTLLQAYAASCNYTDCYQTVLERVVTLEDYIEAFYTTGLFRIERFVLNHAFAKASSDEDVRRLARNECAAFAAWRVEARQPAEILLTDELGRTRSWLKCTTPPGSGGGASLLMFGSAVVFFSEPPVRRGRGDRLFRILLPFHKVYSRGLLHAARRALSRSGAPRS